MQKIKCVVCPIDFSDNAEQIANAAAYIASGFSADLDLIFVAQDFNDYHSFFTPPDKINLKEEMLASAKERMAGFVEEHKEAYNSLGVANVSGQVISGDIAENIIRYSAEANASLIVMGTHGYKGFERIIFGSVAEQVVKTACCPVMTINPYRQDCENFLQKK